MAKTKQNFKVLLLYPNLSMLFSPPLSQAIFTAIFKKEGYDVDIFDVTPYVGEGASAAAENVSVGDEMNTLRSELEGKDDITFQVKSTEEFMQEMMQSRTFDFEKDLGIKSKTGLYDDFVKKINDYKPDMILCSVVEDTFFQAVKLMSLIKDKNIPRLFGGVFITAAPDLALSYPEVNMISLGEGENNILEVAERIRQGLSCDNIKGIWVKKKSGEIIKNPRGPLVDFKKTIPDFSLFEDYRFYRQMGGKNFKSVPIESYRGCPYTCAYCNSPMQNTLARENGLGKFVRRYQFNEFRDYIAAVIDQVNPTYFMFVDDSFLARPRKEIEAFCEMYEEFKIPFWFNTRPENVTAENLKMLKSINCHRMSFGLECGNEEFRSKVLLRHMKNSQLIEKFEIISEGGIPFSMNNIIGFPDETRELIFETIDLNKRIPAYDALTASVFVPYHGTVLRDICVKKGYIDKDLIVCDMHHSMLKMPSLSVEELDGLLRTFPLYVHFDKSMWKDIKRAEKNDSEGLKIFNELKNSYHSEAFALDQDEKMAKYKNKSTGKSNLEHNISN